MKGRGIENYGEASARQMNFEQDHASRKEERKQRDLADFVPGEEG